MTSSTAMNRDEVVDFLSAIIAYDKRTAGEPDVAAWAKASEIGRWTIDEALDALHQHYATSTEFVMPGHLTLLIRQARRDAHERAVTEAYRQPVTRLPAGSGTPGRSMSPGLQAVHDEFNREACARCAAAAGERCVNGEGHLTRIPHLTRLTGRPDAALVKTMPTS